MATASPSGLASLPRLNPMTAGRHKLGHIIFGMQATDHQEWGLLIYRTAYGSQDLWEGYMARFRARVDRSLAIYNQQETLGQALKWTVIENQETLKDVGKAEVREQFREWVRTRSVERDGPGAEYKNEAFLISRVPRYRLCLMVDEHCLASMDKNETIRAVVINGEPVVDAPAQVEGYAGEPEEGDEEEGDEAPVEQEEDGFWMYLDVDWYVSLYQEAAWRSEWRDLYRQPPRLFDGH